MIYHLSSDGVTTREMEMGSPNMISFRKKTPPVSCFGHQDARLFHRRYPSDSDGTHGTRKAMEVAPRSTIGH